MTYEDEKYPEPRSLPSDFMKNILKYSDNPGGCAEYVTSLIRDLSEQLVKSENLFRSLFEQASDGIFFFDTSGNIISVNESFARLHGYSVEEMLRLGLNGLDVEGTAPVSERLQRIMAGEILTFEVKHYHKDGHIFPLEVTAYLISVGSSNEQIIIAIHRDITERKVAEEKLRSLNEELEERVRERTKELERRNHELEQMNKAFVGREMKMVELKKRIRELEAYPEKTGDQNARQ